MAYLKGHWQLFLVTLAVFALWQTPVVVPLKIFVVFLHELSHGLAAVLTGGSIIEISLSPAQGGHAVTQGGSRFLILTAGYLGSLLLGALILIAALRTRYDRAITALCGVVLLLVAALYVRDWFALAFCIGTGAVLIAISRFLGHAANDFTLRILGLTSLIYVPYDICSDTILRSELRSDARMLAEAFGGTTILWGVLWLVISGIFIVFCLARGIGRNSNLTLRRS